MFAPAAKLTFCEVVAVPVRLPVTFPVSVPKKFVEVTAVALTLPENISVVKTLVLGLNVRLASEDKATPDAPFTGENVIK